MRDAHRYQYELGLVTPLIDVVDHVGEKSITIPVHHMYQELTATVSFRLIIRRDRSIRVVN